LSDRQSKGRSAEQIDFPILWVAVRGVQILLPVICAKFAYLSVDADSFSFRLNLLSLVGMVLVVGAILKGIATGTVDSSGIRYRCYFRRKTVSWSDVLEIQWVRSRLKVMVHSIGRCNTI